MIITTEIDSLRGSRNLWLIWSLRGAIISRKTEDNQVRQSGDGLTAISSWGDQVTITNQISDSLGGDKPRVLATSQIGAIRLSIRKSPSHRC